MTSQCGLQTITTHISPKIYRCKDNKTMAFRQLIESNKEMFFFKYHAQNEKKRLVSDLLLSFQKALYEVKAKGLHLDLIMFR